MMTLAGYDVAAIEAAWSRGNDAGDGFAWDAEERRGATKIGRTDDTGDGITVWRRADGTLVGVADANGPWAVVLDMTGGAS